MAFKSAQVTVGTSPTAINGADADHIFGQSLTFWCSVAVAIGGEDVAWANCAQIPANTFYPVDSLEPGEVVYLATQSGSATVHVVHQGV